MKSIGVGYVKVLLHAKSVMKRECFAWSKGKEAF